MGYTQKLGLLAQSVFQDSSLNVGIGAAPSGTYKFEVTGTAKVSSTLLVSGALTGSSSATFSGNLSVTGNNLFSLAATNVTARIGEYDVANRICLTANQNGSNAQDDATKPSWGLLFNANSTDTAFIGHKAAGGGSAALISLLTIAGTGGINIPVNLSNSNTGLDLTNSAGSGYGNAINFYQSTTKYAQILCETSVANTSEIYFKTMVASTVATRLFISSAGNVGIGTTTPSYKLDVVSLGSPSARVRNGDLGGTATLLLETANNFSGTCQTYIQCIGSTGTGLSNLTFGTAGATGDSTATERMRLASNGGLVIGDTSISGTTKFKAISGGAVNGNPLMFVDNGLYNAIGLYSAGADGYNGAVCVMIMGRNTTNSRSINAGGTINASGTDYAEYMTKAIDDNIEKGDIVGVDDNGLLTNIFLNAKSFVVKSTNPSYVGGDTWGNVDIIGKLPLEATDEEKAEYEAKIELARAKVDRVAFSGQVPCNVLGANVGDYIIPINDNGTIKGQAVTNPTFEQYQLSVGKVWKIMEDGRAWIAVKIG